MRTYGLRCAAALSVIGLLSLLAPTHRTRADMPSTPRTQATDVDVSGHVVDDGRCMDALFAPEAGASMPPDAFTLVEEDDGRRYIVSRLAPAKRDAMLAWMRANVIAGRAVVAVPETEDGHEIGWRGFCVVARPLLPAPMLALGPPSNETDLAGVTRTWRALTISAEGHRELELTMAHLVIFLDARGGFHGITTVVSLLDAALDELFF